jgi:ArsR family transcriptional regulator
MDEHAAVFKALSDITRLRLAVILAVRGEICVCHLAEALDEPDFKISRHLAVMRAAGLVEARREGTWMYYRLRDSENELKECLHNCLKSSLVKHPVTQEDLARMEASVCGNG